MIKIEKLQSGFIMLQPSEGAVSPHLVERAISTIPELRRAIGGWACSKINKGSYAKYIIEVKGVKE